MVTEVIDVTYNSTVVESASIGRVISMIFTVKIIKEVPAKGRFLLCRIPRDAIYVTSALIKSDVMGDKELALDIAVNGTVIKKAVFTPLDLKVAVNNNTSANRNKIEVLGVTGQTLLYHTKFKDYVASLESTLINKPIAWNTIMEYEIVAENGGTAAIPVDKSLTLSLSYLAGA